MLLKDLLATLRVTDFVAIFDENMNEEVCYGRVAGVIDFLKNHGRHTKEMLGTRYVVKAQYLDNRGGTSMLVIRIDLKR